MKMGIKKKRQYSDSDKARVLAVLDANGGNISLTAKQTGVPRNTLSDWSKGRKIVPEVTEMRQDKKEELADVFERVARQYLDRALSDEAIGDTKGKDAVIAAATATDKMQLLRGKPTLIVADAAKEALRSIMSNYGLSQEEALPIVAETFGVDVGVISEAVN